MATSFETMSFDTPCLTQTRTITDPHGTPHKCIQTTDTEIHHGTLHNSQCTYAGRSTLSFSFSTCKILGSSIKISWGGGWVLKLTLLPDEGGKAFEAEIEMKTYIADHFDEVLLSKVGDNGVRLVFATPPAKETGPMSREWWSEKLARKRS